MRTKTSKIYISILNSNYEVIVVTEIRFNSGVLNNELIDDRYYMFRRVGRHVIGLAYGKLIVKTSGSIYFFLNLSINKSFCICAVYIPSPLNIFILEQFTQNFEHIIVNKQSPSVIVGDFNISALKWSSGDHTCKLMSCNSSKQ